MCFFKGSDEINQYGPPANKEKIHQEEEQAQQDLSSINDPYERLMAQQKMKSNQPEEENLSKKEFNLFSTKNGLIGLAILAVFFYLF